MTPDPTRNVVVFQLNRGGEETVAADAPARDDDCVRQAWDAARHHRGVRADEVTAVYCDWEPSPADARFVRATFPLADVRHSFRRPGPDGWDEAFAAAGVALAHAARRHEPEFESGPDWPADGEDAGHAGTGRELLPVLWSLSSPSAGIVELLPSAALVPDRLSLTVAWMEPTLHGTIGMSHLTYHDQRELDGMPIEDMLDVAFDNLRVGLKIDGESSEWGDLATLHRQGSQAAAAVALPDFHQRLSAIVKDDRLLVGLTCQDHLQVTGAGSGWAEHLTQAVMAEPPRADPLVPTVLLLDGTTVQVVAEAS